MARSALEGGVKKALQRHIEEIKELYVSDSVPWVVGYSGGKDSTATLQLVWIALTELEPARRSKPVYVISTDTLVENPVISSWVAHSLDVMKKTAEDSGLPIYPNRLTPEVIDTFWVNLIGKGYPAPRPKFRWCTERLKIKPSNKFIGDVVQNHGETILVLGTRKAESTARARTMARLEKDRVRERLSPNASLPNSMVYSPIEDWSNDDVWLFLMQSQNPWGINNKDLLTMYQGASPDGECPLVVDTSTPSCGDSRFGCWVCTLVDKDKSMQAMIQNDQDKEWMLPLLQIRDELDIAQDRHLRDFRRMSGSVQLFNGRPIPGPYKQKVREHWLRRVLSAQRWIRENGPEYVRGIELITLAELLEIRRIWLTEKHEIEDSLPRIYEESLGESLPVNTYNRAFSQSSIELLENLCDGDRLLFEGTRALLNVEWQYRTKSRRAGLFGALGEIVKKHYYFDEDDAVDFARKRESQHLSK